MSLLKLVVTLELVDFIQGLNVCPALVVPVVKFYQLVIRVVHRKILAIWRKFAMEHQRRLFALLFCLFFNIDSIKHIFDIVAVPRG